MSLAIGIDLGTTNSCAAVLLNGNLHIIETKDEQRTVPSFVFYGDDGIVVGESAVSRSAINPHKGIYDAKRLIGRKFDDPDLNFDKKQWPFTVVKDQKGECLVQLIHEGKMVRVRPEEISAEVLRKLKQEACRQLQQDICNAVITVPAYFTNPQRQATKDAAKIAGLNVLKLLNEPTAAALAFVHNEQIHRDRTVLVYDLGGGTFDVSLIRFSKDNMGVVLSTSGDSHLGGQDFDQNLLIDVLCQLKSDFGFTVDHLNERVRRRAIRRLRSECEFAKRKLSQVASVEVSLQEFHGLNVELEITRQRFEDVNLKLFEDTISIVEETLASAQVGKEQVDDIVLVGGSTRIPKVRQMLKELFKGKEPNRTVNPDEAVALGAAIQAASLNDTDDDFYTLIDATPFSLGIEVLAKESMNVLIKKNTKIPAFCDKTYYTTQDDQPAVSIRIYEGESRKVEENTLLGQFVIDNITPRPAGQVEIHVKFHIDLDGILKVTAKETSRNIWKELHISLTNGRMTEEEITASHNKMLANKAEVDD